MILFPRVETGEISYTYKEQPLSDVTATPTEFTKALIISPGFDSVDTAVLTTLPLSIVTYFPRKMLLF